MRESQLGYDMFPFSCRIHSWYQKLRVRGYFFTILLALSALCSGPTQEFPDRSCGLFAALDQVVIGGESQIVDLGNVLQGDWDSFTVLPGPMAAEEIQSLGIDSGTTNIQDGTRRILLVRESNILCQSDVTQLPESTSTVAIDTSTFALIPRSTAVFQVKRVSSPDFCRKCYFYELTPISVH